MPVVYVYIYVYTNASVQRYITRWRHNINARIKTTWMPSTECQNYLSVKRLNRTTTHETKKRPKRADHIEGNNKWFRCLCILDSRSGRATFVCAVWLDFERDIYTASMNAAHCCHWLAGVDFADCAHAQSVYKSQSFSIQLDVQWASIMPTTERIGEFAPLCLLSVALLAVMVGIGCKQFHISITQLTN